MNDSTSSKNRVCPAAHAGWLSTPLRGLIQNPQRILHGLVVDGDTAVDLGCGPGFFTLPLARMAGEAGTVIAVDLQQEMLDRLRLRAERAGLAQRVRLHRCTEDSLGLSAAADFALAFYMVHEVPRPDAFLEQVQGILRPGGRFLLVEPRGHVSSAAWQRSLGIAAEAGMRVVSEPRLLYSRAALIER